MTVDLWTEASRDLEAEEADQRMTRAKVATASLWPFLALAQSESEFDHRLALASDRFVQKVDADLLEPLLASLREDFKLASSSEEDEAEEESTEDKGEWQKPWEKKGSLEPLQVFHVASGRWITVQATDSPMTRDNPQGNDAYFEDETEEGPNTGQTGQFPQHPTGADPADPINSMFPAQPSPWTPANNWVERPMNFAPYKSAAGNPNFFSGGPEGVSGEPQAGFPADVALPEPDERVDMYGTTPPLQSGGTTGDGHPYSNPAVHASRHPFGRGFYDPKDTSVRVVAVGGPYGSGNSYNPAGSEVGHGTSTAPQPPPSMMPGGPGSEAIPPMGGGEQSTSDMAAKQENPMDSMQQMTARRVTADPMVRDRPDMFNPSGVKDEYDDNTWDNAAKQRPMQPAEHRNINTPQRPAEPIGLSSSEGTEAEEGRRAASLLHYAEIVAARTVRNLVFPQGVAA